MTSEVRRYLAVPQTELSQIVEVIQSGGMLKPSSINAFLETAVKHDHALSGIEIVDQAMDW
jgi:hypothetical protein